MKTYEDVFRRIEAVKSGCAARNVEIMLKNAAREINDPRSPLTEEERADLRLRFHLARESAIEHIVKQLPTI